MMPAGVVEEKKRTTDIVIVAETLDQSDYNGEGLSNMWVVRMKSFRLGHCNSNKIFHGIRIRNLS